MAHEDLGLDKAAHKPGCVTRHVSSYIEDNTCSHRWQAASRAPASWSQGYADPMPEPSLLAATLTLYERHGKLTPSGAYKPFATQFHPWRNNAHHIIPRSTLARALEEIAKAAAPEHAAMFDAMIVFLLEEEYNLNDQTNMLMLPLDHRDAERLGLPEHLEGSAWNHPAYNKAVKSQVKLKLDPVYDALAGDMRLKKHETKWTRPAARRILESISNATYDAILARTRAAKAPSCLDSIASLLYK